MPSPFPGMNPYLEQPSIWEDFHNRFMTYAGEAITAQVRPHFLVKLEERVFIEIRDRHNRELVTMIEVLSPTNKR